jgi:hypothetical protein
MAPSAVAIEKRVRILESLQASEMHQNMTQLKKVLAPEEWPCSPPATPRASDTAMSKRTWETLFLQYKSKVKTWQAFYQDYNASHRTKQSRECQCPLS